MKTVMRKLLVVISLAASLLLVIGFLGAALPLADSFAHFRHLLVSVAALSGVLLFLMARWTMAALSLAMAGIAIAVSAPHLPLMGPPDVGPGKYKLIQFNIWAGNHRRDEAVAWLIAQKPDVVTLQELTSRTMDVYDGLAGELPHGIVCKYRSSRNVALRSRHPFKTQTCVEWDGLVWAQIERDGKLLTVASTHLLWPYPVGQWHQLADLAPAYAAMPRPVLMAGDFNATPWSAAVKTVERAIGSSTVRGFRISLWMDFFHDGKGIPALPIDHVLVPEQVTVKRITVGPNIGSDHRPVIMEFDF